ncbi:succinate dehydrogenase/fumarate reductase flavoprotein subunit [Lactobacillus colini]|uniref:Urocanate reductase n=1 Tax=Lactobacillus colini TaxID=1819254 RepID=A0ABS4MC00_9LACO|nr:FAD-binding protein [Lactobacillus colini]MBP2057203.1 succinate dehydrogenase/fumarate reductase flavoprotein subunit [Lactobacillus colini]
MEVTKNMKWNAAYDVLVLGFGGAGATAARFAADHGSKVLLVDAAPYGHEGGNTRYSAQHIAMAHNRKKIGKYYDQLAKPYNYSKKTMNAYLDGFVNMPAYMKKYLGVEPYIWSRDWQKDDQLDHKDHLCEYPEFEGSETFDFALVHNRDFDAELWKLLRQKVVDRKDKIDIWLNSRATKLLTQNNQVIGAVVQRNHHDYYIYATQGIVLATGGFENNAQMQQDYLHVTKLTPLGSLYNRGDGIKMASDIGAQLWHMANYESLGIVPSYVIAEEDGKRGRQIGGWKNVKSGSIFAVSNDGTRFMREDAKFRHGHIYDHGEYNLPRAYDNAWLIFDEKQYQKFVDEKNSANARYSSILEKIVSANSLTELAKLTSLPQSNLSQSIKLFNKFAEDGSDIEFNRDPSSMEPFTGKKLFAIKLAPAILNTQGGTKHNEKAQVLNNDDKPIDHLYCAGELGGMCVNRYQGGGNLAECLIFGKIAGENVSQELKNSLPKLSNPIPAINDIVAGENLTKIPLADNQYLGATEAGIGGRIVVRVTYEDKTIKNVEVVENHETEGIGAVAIQKLPEEIVAANSVDVDAVSGASTTTRAVKDAVKKAIDKANK